MTDNEMIDLIKGGYEAHARGDVAGAMAALHPEIEIVQTDVLPWGGVHRGHAGAGTFFRLLAQNLDAKPTPEEYVVAGDQVAVVGRLRGRVRSNGRAFDLRIVHLWTIRDGKVARFEAVIDTPAMLAELAPA